MPHKIFRNRSDSAENLRIFRDTTAQPEKGRLGAVVLYLIDFQLQIKGAQGGIEPQTHALIPPRFGPNRVATNALGSFAQIFDISYCDPFSEPAHRLPPKGSDEIAEKDLADIGRGAAAMKRAPQATRTSSAFLMIMALAFGIVANTPARGDLVITADTR